MTQETTKLALEALKKCRDRFFPLDQHETARDLDWAPVNIAIAHCEEALAQPAQEPVAWIEKDMQCDDFDPDSVTCEKPARAADGWEWIPLYTTAPAAQRQPLPGERAAIAKATGSAA